MGPSKDLVKSHAGLPNIDSIVFKSRSAFYIPEPSRPPPTAIDAVIDAGEVHMLQFMNTLETRYRDRDHYAHWNILTQIVQQLAHDYGISITHHSLRAAILACAGAIMFIEGQAAADERRIDEYSNRVYQVLMNKDPTSPEPEDYFLIFFLAIAESFRICCYQNTHRPVSAITRARAALSVHVCGSLAITKRLSNDLEAAIRRKFGQAWFHAQDLLALWGVYANPPEIMELASSYLEQLSKTETEYKNSTDETIRFRLVMATAATASAFGNFVVSLAKVLLEKLSFENSIEPLQTASITELQKYLEFPDHDTGFWKQVTASLMSRDRHYEVMQLLASRVILHLVKGRSSVSYMEGFMWANELVHVAESFHDESLYRDSEGFGHRTSNEGGLQRWDERAAVIFVGIASLVVPPVESSHRNLPCSEIEI